MTPSWRRNLYIITAAELVAVAGFTVVMPFLPYYVQDLGVTEPDQVKLWTGWLFSAHAITMAVMAPIWGLLADRHGRKIMVERAMFGGALLFAAMGVADSPQQVLVLRALQGCLTGTVPAATALVASTVPRERSGSSLGLLQTGIFLGASVGPFAGGAIADGLGYRAAFWVTSGCLFAAGLGVHWLVGEEFSRPEKLADQRLWEGLLIVLQTPSLRALFLIRMVARLASRVVWPMIPLFIQEIVVGTDRLATVAGSVSGAATLASAVGAFLLGRASDRVGHRKLLILCSLGMALGYLPQSRVTSPLQLALLQMVVGFLMAGVLASIAASLAALVPEGRQGAVYGVNTTVVAGANSLAPLLGAGVAIAWGLRPVFLVAAGLFLLGGILALWLMPSRNAGLLQEPPGGV